MKTHIVLITLALVAVTGAVIEGLVEGLSAELVQANGLLIMICTGILVLLKLSAQFD